jgi:hypothetical protein
LAEGEKVGMASVDLELGRPLSAAAAAYPPPLRRSINDDDVDDDGKPKRTGRRSN